MTSQPLVPSMCVDYLSHPLSTEHLLVCYQQITRQVAHAPQSAKAAAISFQHQSQLLVELQGQHHQNLAMPQTKERPAPVGCQAELKRMQNALWRRSSQSSLAKDVPLVRPESLNWQKECDVLWLYGPLYDLGLAQSTAAYTTDNSSSSSDSSSSSSPSTPPTPSSPVLPCPDSKETEESKTTPAAKTTITSTTTTMTITETAETATLSTSSGTSPEPPSQPSKPSFSESSVTFASPVPSASSTTSSDSDANDSPPSSSNNPIAQPNQPVANTARSIVKCPTKSAMKRQRTRLQVFEELRAFTRSTTYAAWTQALASTATSTSTAVLDGSKSEPISPITSSPSSFLLPIFPSPTKYHFRSQDRRRASFPKSSSHSNLNLNVNINMMGLSMQQVNNIAVSESRQAVIPKHLRFSLEVQELVFLQSSPPFRISRAKPTRAHSDPAIQTSSSSSFIAPSHSSASSSPSNVTAAIQAASLSSSPSSTNLLQQQHQGNLISTATASSSSFENTTTTFIKIRAQDFRGLGIDEDDIPECKYNDDYLDEYLFEDCRESGEDEDDEEYEEGDDECEPYCESRTRLSSKDGVVARRIQREDRHRHPSMLWQVYTAVTGVKELIAWYGSMVYHSSSL